MLAPYRPPNKKRIRMDLTLPVDGKEKSPKKGFFRRISSSFRSPFSPKTVEPPQQIDDFESTKSHLESDTEENNKAIEERVEAELQKDEIVAQPTTTRPPIFFHSIDKEPKFLHNVPSANAGGTSFFANPPSKHPAPSLS